MSPLVETYSLCCLPIELPSFAASFASIYSHKMSYSPLKMLHGKLELPTTNNNILSPPRCPYLPLSWGWQEDEVAWWVCVIREIWKPPCQRRLV